MRRMISIVSSVMLVVFLATTAQAGNVRFRHGSPSFGDAGLSLFATGTLAGLGNEAIMIDLNAMANEITICVDPITGQPGPPIAVPVPVPATGSTSIPASAIQKGQASFTMQTQNPTPNPIPGAPDCPNPTFTEFITDLAFRTAEIRVEQPLGAFVLTATCTFTPPTANTGNFVPAKEVTCSTK